MILKDFLRQIASRSANVDRGSLLDYTNNALQELWDSADFPGSLDEESFTPYSTGEALVSFPNYVDSIRGVRPCDYMVTEVYSKSAGFQNDFYLNSPWMWREIGRFPLKRNLEEASQLTIGRNNKSTQRAVIYISGKTDVASNESEQVVFESGEILKQTEKAYETLTLLGKDIVTDSDFQVYDSAGNEVSVIPSNFLEVSHLVVQIQKRCNYTCVIGCGCVRVLYKRKHPPFYGDLDLIPSGIEGSLMMKVQELIDLRGTDTLDRARMMFEKSESLWNRMAYNRDRSLIKPIRQQNNPFIRYSNNDL